MIDDSGHFATTSLVSSIQLDVSSMPTLRQV
jgi:hypothetical protein